MATKKETQKKTTAKKTTTKKSTAKKNSAVKLTFKPIASGAKEINLLLKTKKMEEKDGRTVQVTAPLIEGLPTVLTVQKDEVIEVTKKQCDQLEELGFVETEKEYKERMDFVDNLQNQHPDKLSFDQLSGINNGQLTARDSQYKVYMDRLVRL